MTFTELDSPDALTDFINSNEVSIVTFSATWCGPCKQSRPKLEVLAKEASCPIPIGYVYESDLQEDDAFDTFQSFFLKSNITGFPTYIVFKGGAEVERLNGSDLEELKQIMARHAPTK